MRDINALLPFICVFINTSICVCASVYVMYLSHFLVYLCLSHSYMYIDIHIDTYLHVRSARVCLCVRVHTYVNACLRIGQDRSDVTVDDVYSKQIKAHKTRTSLTFCSSTDVR